MKRSGSKTLSWAAAFLAISGTWASGGALGAPLSLKEAIDRGMNRSPNVAQAEADYQAQVERKRAAWSNVGPKVSATYNETRFEDKQVATLPGPAGEAPASFVIRDDVTKTGSLTVTQPLTGLYGLVEFGNYNSLQTKFSAIGLDRARRDAAYTAAEAYLQAYQAQEQEVISEASIAAARSAFQDAQALQRVGRLNQGDLLKFQLALSQAEARAAQARATKKIALSSLMLAIQATPGEALELEKELPKLAPVDVALDQSIDKANGRPELKQAEIGAEIANYSKKLAYAKMIPSVNAFYKHDRNFGEITGFGGEKDTKYVGLSVQWDIWNNGSSIFEVREAIAQRNKAEAALTAARDGIRLDVIQAAENYTAAKESMVLATNAVAQAEEAYRIDQTRFKNGQLSATDLIQSETSKSNAQGQLVAAETQLLTWYFRLQKATGQDQPSL